MFSNLDSNIGYQPIGFGNLDKDTTQRQVQGMLLSVTDPWWGTAEVVWGRATAAIRAQGLCTMLPVFDSALQAYRWDMTEVPLTSNLARPLCVALGSFTTGQYGYFMVTGVTPVNCSVNVAADTSFGIAATGQGGAVTAGRQVLNARIVAPGTTTVAKANSQAASGSRLLQVQNSDGWFVGAYLSGTGIAAGTTVVAIDASGRFVTLSADTTALVNGTVTATYNNGSIHYNVAHINRCFAQGAIT